MTQLLVRNTPNIYFCTISTFFYIKIHLWKSWTDFDVYHS